ncbi:hypothetical protein H8D29_02395 [PVC group bacterium]|nr:hypothetical protein [PVC group bacterium]
MITYIVKQPDGSTFPPMTIDELRALVSDGRVTVEHSIQIEGGKTWHPALDIAGLLPSGRASKKQKRVAKNKEVQQDRVANANIKNVAGALVTDKAPFIREKAIELKGAIMSSPKKMVITAGCSLVFFLIVIALVSGGSGIQAHLDSIKSAANNLSIASNSGDAHAMIEAMEEMGYAYESMNAESEALVVELTSMSETQRHAIALSFHLTLKQSLNTTPSDEARLALLTQLGNDPSLSTRFEELVPRNASLHIQNTQLADLLNPNS